eukprot:365621-Chlamydomonas_euryale.AAC.7
MQTKRLLTALNLDCHNFEIVGDARRFGKAKCEPNLKAEQGNQGAGNTARLYRCSTALAAIAAAHLSALLLLNPARQVAHLPPKPTCFAQSGLHKRSAVHEFRSSLGIFPVTVTMHTFRTMDRCHSKIMSCYCACLPRSGYKIWRDS